MSSKLQLAIEYAHRRTREANTWVYCVHAGTQARLEEDLSTIADAVKLPGRKQPKTNLPQLTYDWLSNDRNTPLTPQRITGKNDSLENAGTVAQMLTTL
jgi:hypothetical protein